MAYVITDACIGTKDRSCVDVCPVDCIHDDGDVDLIAHGRGMGAAAPRIRGLVWGNANTTPDRNHRNTFEM